jgi:MFS transporter, AAHS family, 4-hydroxybenzoate transporter
MARRVVDITEVIDSARYIGVPLGVTVLTIFMMLVDGYDLETMSFVAPALVPDWHISRELLTPVLTASMIGMAIGSIAMGWLGDRIGRKNSYITCLAFLCVGSLLSGQAQGLWALFAWRLLTGIGLGGVTPLAATLITEWTSRRVRSVAIACGIVAVPLGGMVGAAVAQWIIPAYGWRMIFHIGAALPLAFFVMAWFLLPESPKFLAQSPKRHAQLARALNSLVRERRFDGTEDFKVAEPPAPPGNWLAIILKPPYRSTTVLLWIAFAFNTLGLYAFVNWLPTVLTSTGMPLHGGLEGAKYFNFGGFFGAVGGAVLIGFIGSRLVGSGLSLVGAIATFLIGMMVTAGMGNPQMHLLIMIAVAGMALNGMQCFLYVVGAHSYPTYIRASGVGCAQTVSRIGGVLSSVVGGAYFVMRPLPPVSDFFYVVGAVVLVVVASYFSMRTHIVGRRATRALEAAAAP